jgi:tRNA(adenine34) deaminase
MHDDTYFMKAALEQAQIAFDLGEIPIGAVVVWDQKIIARGHNQTEQLKDPTAHAEMIAITAACNQIGSKYLSEATVYVTVEPCLMCTGALYWSKVNHIVFGASDEKNGYQKHTKEQWLFHPKASLTKGIMANECAQLMKDFFSTKR